MKILNTLCLIAIIRYASITINAHLDLVEPYDGWVNYFYLPAGVNVITMLVCGYIGAIGVGDGSLAWNIIHKNVDYASALSLSAAPILSCVASLFFSEKLSGRAANADWRIPSVRDLLIFVVIYSLMNSLVHHLVFPYVFGNKNFSVISLIQMCVGDFLGAVFLFVCLNILVSAAIDVMKYLAPKN